MFFRELREVRRPLLLSFERIVLEIKALENGLFSAREQG
jgi:hypothetical protein